MKPIWRLRRTAAALAALSLSLALPAAVAGDKDKPAARGAKPPSAAPGPGPASAGAGPRAATGSPIGQVVFQVLLGEIALQRGNANLAVDAYADLARRTRDPKVLARAAELATFAQRFDVAYDIAKLWLEVEPDSTPARQTLTAILVLQERPDELGAQIAILLERDRENLPDNLLRINRMLARYSDKAAVYRMLSDVLRRYDGIAEAHFALATAAFHAGDREAAQREIGKALTLRPDWPLAALFNAQILARENTGAALDALERFVAANPDARDVRLQLARALVGEKRYEAARRHFTHLLAETPDSPELLYPAAVLALQQNDVATAEPMLKRLMAQGGPSEKTVAAFYLGQIAEERKQNAEAIAYYQQVASGEQFVSAQIRAASLMAGEKQGPTQGLAAARAHLQQSAERYPPGQTQFVIAEAQLVREAGDNATALALLESVLVQKPDHPEVLYEAALLAERLGRLDVLERNLRRVIELRPDNAHAFNALGYTFAERGIRLDEAYDLIARARELAPDDPFIMDSMGWVLFRKGDLQGALGLLQKAFALRADAEIAAHLGEVLWQLDRRDEALSTWNDAAKKHPGNEVLDAVRKKFKP